MTSEPDRYSKRWGYIQWDLRENVSEDVQTEGDRDGEGPAAEKCGRPAVDEGYSSYSGMAGGG